jgi:hypothetical protein
VQKSFEDSKLQRNLRRGSVVEVFKRGQGRTTSKGDKDRIHPVEFKSQWKNFGYLAGVIKEP